jgi:hypothetical protein
LSEAQAAIEAAYPEVDLIRCYEYSVNQEFPNQTPDLRKSGGKWLPTQASLPRSSPPQIKWQVE